MNYKKEYLNIAMLGHKRIPSREGGVEIVVKELSTRMAAQGHQVTCYNRGGHHVSGKQYGNKKHIDQYEGVRLVKVFTIDGKGLAAMSSSVFASIRAAFGKYDIVHFHSEGPAAMLWIPKLFGKRCIVTVHGLDHEREKWGGFAKKYILLGEKTAVKYADEIIVLNKDTQDYFWNRYHRKTHLIPNGVEKMKICPPKQIAEKYGLEKDGYLLFLGRIVPEKGLWYLIEAFKNIDTQKRLVISGGSSDTGEFMREIKSLAKGDSRILFTDFVEGEILEELYSNAYLYVLPSDLEGMPLSLLEAMSYGNCCVVSDIAECTEVVEDKAVVFPKGNVKALQETLQRLVDDESIVQKYKDGAAEFICAKYDWDNVVEKTLELYRGGEKEEGSR